ncbi:DUF4132 domain-containing protein [Cellulomonas phragmiteti]|uniref:DUF4132 domain-containing protein n=1 Tax=Cellulomonas phragmiteti TaxID=478780 RepID=A0ABQ4DMQ1_9CELL|nr:DUF4132 domain-containing protein [Cellulomonas phragmiteti]GIG40629.1 hypothetical protein Cph01nite_23910 [Cellulomonas phragmiteti]
MALFGLGRRRAEADSRPPRAWVRHLEAVVAPLPDARGVSDYVLTGRDPAPLATLRSSHHPWLHPWLQSPAGQPDVDAAAVRGLYAGFGTVEATVLRRWGHVLDAVQGQVQAWGTTMAPLAGAHWPDLVIAQMIASTPGTGPLPATLDDLARVAALDGAGARDLVAAVLTVPLPARYRRYGFAGLGRLPGLGDALLEHRDLVRTALTSGAVEARVAVLEIVGAAFPDDGLDAVVDELAQAATGSSGQVRDRAAEVLARAPGSAAALRTVAVEGTSTARRHALELLVQHPEHVGWARSTALADRAASVQDLVAQWDTAAAAATASDDDLVLDPLPPVRWAVPRAAAEACARALVDDLVEVTTTENQRRVARHVPGHGTVHTDPVPTERTYRDVVALLVRDAPPPTTASVPVPFWTATRALEKLAADGLLDAVSAVKLVAALGLLAERYGNGGSPQVIDAVHARTGAPDLRTLQAMYDQAGLDGRAVIWRSYSRSYGARLGRTWDDAAVWPFVADNLDWIMGEGTGTGWDVDDLARFTAVRTLPRQPARLVELLLALALGTRKTLRAPAQDALAGTPGIALRAAAALVDGRSEIRLAAAQWLARLADPAALPALQAAWAKERQDVVRGALLDALVAVGERAETYLDPQATSVTAAKAVAKGLPAALDWCAWDTLPEVRWASSGQVVPREVVQWLCATAVRAKSPVPDAVLRQYAALFDRADRERLAHHLLTGWLHADTLPHPPADAEDRARQDAATGHRWLTDPTGPYPGLTVEQLAAALLPGYLRQPAGSAIASKGVLAVVAACGGRDVVGPTERYLREWYGQRAAQGKALIAMLAWVDDPAATQLVLAIGSRFRTKSFQDEAIAQATALAERRGWTVDELADRTIPTGGFDDDGVLELPYGPRTFVARLLPDLTVELRDPDGKVVKALPQPRASDDAEQAKDSRKALTAARKDVRSIATLQQQRLYEALCTERSWSAEDWQRYLCAHPVVGPAVRRLVWVAQTEGADPVVFRPLDDGTLTDVDDEPVTLPAASRVRLAHDSVLTPEQVGAWTAHLADYEVAPLFEQLGRGLRTLTATERTRGEITDVEGHLVGAFALRGRATRLGYTRGPTEDAGWFYSYVKRFPTLGVVAEVAFTGNFLPEEDRTVALRGLSFHRPGPDGRAEPLTLGDVPAVLVSECWHDVRQMAAQGTGFDPDWQKTTEY